MSTRKLIALALGCALVILLAGGIQLVLLSNRDDVRVEALAVGQSTQVGDNRVTVLSSEVSGRTVRLSVSVAGPGDLEALARDGFAIHARDRVIPAASDQASCQQTGGEAHCTLVFDTGDTNLTNAVAVYLRANVSWRLMK